MAGAEKDAGGRRGHKRQKKEVGDCDSEVSQLRLLLETQLEENKKLRAELSQMRNVIQRMEINHFEPCEEEQEEQEVEEQDEQEEEIEAKFSEQEMSDEEQVAENISNNLEIVMDEIPQSLKQKDTAFFPAISKSKLKKMKAAKKMDKATNGNTAAATTSKASVGNSTTNEVRKVDNVAPLIKVYNVTHSILIEKLKQVLGHNLFSVKRINRNLTGIIVNTKQDHGKVKEMLENENVKFYTFTPNEEKPKTVMVKGLCCSHTVERVQEYLADLNIGKNIIKIIRLVGSRWILQLTHETDLKEIFKIKTILFTKVQILKHKSNGVVQCKNCQRFGHVSINCRMDYRCVKCGISHGPKNCNIPNRENNTKEITEIDPNTGATTKKIGMTVKCVNCNTEGHVASYKNCPKRLEILKKVQEKRQKKVETKSTQNPRSFSSTRVVNGMSYSQAIGGNASNNTIEDECKRILGQSLESCVQKVNNFHASYAKLKDDASRELALVTLILSMKKHV